MPEATLGAQIEVPTSRGPDDDQIPPDTKSGQKFRLREMGVPLPGGLYRGDEFVEVAIVPPAAHDQKVRAVLMKVVAKLSIENPRDKIGYALK